MIEFILGMFVGAIIGVLVMCLVQIGKEEE